MHSYAHLFYDQNYDYIYAMLFLATACFAGRGLSHRLTVIYLCVYIYIHIYIYLFSSLTFFENATPPKVVGRF